jgi:hypothetical protein
MTTPLCRKAATIRPNVSENVKKENYTSVTIHIIIKSKAEIWALNKLCVNVTPGKYLYIVKMWSVTEIRTTSSLAVTASLKLKSM